MAGATSATATSCVLKKRFKAHLGVQYAIATSGCTDALHMGMAALGIGPGDEIVLADTNNAAPSSR